MWFSRRPLLALFLIWAATTAIDMDKAFHIDEPVHLQIAQWIEHHPSRPMSGLVNWGDRPQSVSLSNQPPGFFYLIAITGHLFGYTELPMHALRALFSLLAILCFYRLAKHFSPKYALFLTALLALGPVFLVNQGLMTDVPLLAMQLLFFNLLLVPGTMHPGVRYALAGLAISGALFIKYTSLPLLVLFPVALLLLGERRWLVSALIPFALIACWSIWNLHEFGAVQMVGRRSGIPSLRNIFAHVPALLVCAGAMAPFTPVFIRALFPDAKSWLRNSMVALFILGVLVVAFTYAGFIREVVSDRTLRIAFTLNGLLLAAMVMSLVPKRIDRTNAERWILLGWAGSFALFVIGFAPMIATRHLLLLLPPVLLLLAPMLERTSVRLRSVALACTAVLGFLLTVSDKHFADFYRRSAPQIANDLRGQGHVWALGHWGWQWYAEKAGMSIYASGESPVAVGDILVVPVDVDKQSLPPGLRMRSFISWEEPPGPATFFCVEQFASLYTSGFSKLPWTLSRSHHKTIIAYRVTAVP